MTLIKKNGGLAPFRNMLTDFFETDDLMDRFWNREWIPAVNIAETEKSFEVELAVPGMKKEDFKIKLENGVLTISAEREEEKKEKEKNYTRREYQFNSFQRSFTLPENAKEDEIRANYDNGMLKLVIAKKAVTVAKSKKIEIA